MEDFDDCQIHGEVSFETDSAESLRENPGICTVLAEGACKEDVVAKLQYHVKNEDGTGLRDLLKQAWENKWFSHQELVSIINPSNQESTWSFNNNEYPEYLYDPILCSFLIHKDFESRPCPTSGLISQKKKMNFNQYIADNDGCISDKDLFKSCKKDYCDLYQSEESQEECIGKLNVDYEDYQDDLL